MEKHSTTRILIGFVVCEVAYVTFVRVLLQISPLWSMRTEVYWSGLRLLSLAALIVLFRRLKPERPTAPAIIPKRCYWAGLMLLAPLLTKHYDLTGSLNYLVAADWPLVGLREELAYRGILLVILARRFGTTPALLITGAVFAIYHFGIWPFTGHQILEYLLCGTIFGCVYLISGRIVLCAMLHALYGAVYSLPTLVSPPLPVSVRTVILAVTLAAVLAAEGSSRSAAASAASGSI